MAKKKAGEEITLKPVTDWAEDAGLKKWQMLAVCRAERWLSDKQVSKAEFDAAFERFNSRAMGG